MNERKINFFEEAIRKNRVFHGVLTSGVYPEQFSRFDPGLVVGMERFQRVRLKNRLIDNLDGRLSVLESKRVIVEEEPKTEHKVAQEDFIKGDEIMSLIGGFKSRQKILEEHSINVPGSRILKKLELKYPEVSLSDRTGEQRYELRRHALDKLVILGAIRLAGEDSNIRVSAETEGLLRELMGGISDVEDLDEHFQRLVYLLTCKLEEVRTYNRDGSIASVTLKPASPWRFERRKTRDLDDPKHFDSVKPLLNQKDRESETYPPVGNNDIPVVIEIGEGNPIVERFSELKQKDETPLQEIENEVVDTRLEPTSEEQDQQKLTALERHDGAVKEKLESWAKEFVRLGIHSRMSSASFINALRTNGIAKLTPEFLSSLHEKRIIVLEGYKGGMRFISISDGLVALYLKRYSKGFNARYMRDSLIKFATEATEKALSEQVLQKTSGEKSNGNHQRVPPNRYRRQNN